MPLDAMLGVLENDIRRMHERMRGVSQLEAQWQPTGSPAGRRCLHATSLEDSSTEMSGRASKWAWSQRQRCGERDGGEPEVCDELASSTFKCTSPPGDRGLELVSKIGSGTSRHPDVFSLQVRPTATATPAHATGRRARG
jgi:hypothetical protein